MSGEKKFIIGIIIASVILLVGAGFFVNKMGPAGSSSVSTPVSAEQKKILEIMPDDYIKGNKKAQVTLIEYLDFECEACGYYFPFVKQLSEEFKDDIRFVSRYFPLQGHKNGLPAALAVEAASKQNKYWEMYNIVFENQKAWGERPKADPTIFEKYAKQIGLNMEQFKKDIASKEVKDRVERDRLSGEKLGVNATPTFFLNGEKLQNLRSPEDFKNIIRTAVLKVKKTP